MATSVYSTRLLAFAADGTPPAFTVPAGYICVVRDIDVSWGGGSMVNFAASVNAVAKFWQGQFNALSEPQVAQWRGRQVVYPGEDLVFAADGPVDGMISGYLLGNT